VRGVATIFLIWKAGWNFLEQWTYIIDGTIPIIISYLYILICEKTFNPVTYLENEKKKVYISKYKQFNFDVIRLKELESEICELEKEIEKNLKELGF